MANNFKRKPTILIAADTGTLVSDIKKALAGQQCELFHANRTPQAIAILTAPNASIDLAIVELEFPSGLDLIGHLIRQTPRTTKVMAASAFFNSAFLQRLKGLGVDDVAQCPLSRQTWRKAIENLLRGEVDSPGRPFGVIK